MKTLIYSSLLLATSLKADIPINAGLSGLWHDNLKPGQGVLLDVVETNGTLFAGWFTYRPNDTSPDNQYWLTMSGPYAANHAELTIYQTNHGLFNQPSEVVNQPIGIATLQFSSCYEATFNFQFDGILNQETIALSRVTPDVFCAQQVNGFSPPINSSFNYPPIVSNLQTEMTDEAILITFDLADSENDSLDLKLNAISADDQVYAIPTSYLTGHVDYPVLSGLQKTIRWHHSSDLGFQQLDIEQFKIQVVADDLYLGTLQQIIDAVSEQRIVADIQALEGTRHHQASPAGLAQARTYIQSQMSHQPLTVAKQAFNHQGSTGINIIGTLTAINHSDDVYIIDGHYDTVGGTPGADDNASGTAGMLEAMRVLSQFNTNKNIKFIAFDKEELGLVGSRHYASRLNNNEKTLGVINFEMIGYTCSGQAECINFPNADTSIYNIHSRFTDDLSDTFTSIAQTHVPSLKVTTVQDDGDSNFRRSDHAPFWDLGIDALFLTDGANFRTPHYHQSSDVLSTLDTQFATQVVKVTVGTLAKLAEIHHTGQALSDTLILINP